MIPLTVIPLSGLHCTTNVAVQWKTYFVSKILFLRAVVKALLVFSFAMYYMYLKMLKSLDWIG
jgi:hypothetical protein